MTPAPRRRFRATIELHADDFEGLVRELDHLAVTLECHPGIEGGKRVIVSGGCVATLTEDAAMTPERYRAEADAWLAERRARRQA